jgi:toxin YoeB
MQDLVFDLNAIEDLKWWIENNNRIAIKIINLIKEIEKHPFEGLGKPEPLKYDLSGCWSRRITADDRIVYQVTNTQIKILECRYHYKKK